MGDVVDRLRDQARRRPDHPAVVEADGSVAYAAFVAKAETFAAALANQEHPRVLVALPQGADAYAAMFGTLMAGGTYAPVNVSSPEARLVHICVTFDPHFVIARGRLAEVLAEAGSASVLDPDLVAAEGVARESRRSDIAYVIFTSGSTGTPKGVAIPRSALSHYVDWLGPAMDIGPDDRMSQHPNIGFDLSVLDIYGALCYGATLYPFVRPIDRLLPARLVAEAQLTIWNSVPSVVSLMEAGGEVDDVYLRSVRLFTFCGEVLRSDQVAALFRARPDAIVLNTYGPTEATVAMTCRRFTADDFAALCDPSAPVGEPIGHMRLDLVGDTDAGEIVISGPQVAAGYWKDDTLTREKFRDFEIEGNIVKAFFTGDYAVRRDGETYFAGRKDDMVKLRGHRIHLGEIREALRRAGWASSFVFERDGALYAVIESGDTEPGDETKVLKDLAGLLDKYFLPRQVWFIPKFPTSGNDKVDSDAIKRLFP